MENVSFSMLAHMILTYTVLFNILSLKSIHSVKLYIFNQSNQIPYEWWRKRRIKKKTNSAHARAK